MNATSRTLAAVARALLAAAALAGPVTAAAGQARPASPGRPASADRAQPMVEVAPIRCWWRTSQGAVTIGEPFDVQLTCAVLETDSVQVVPDETRLTVAGVQLKPFEVIGGERPADTRAGQRRFFQYRYTVRLLDPDSIGDDVTLPNLIVTYRVQSRVASDATLAGREFTYVMPGLPVHVLSLVPESGVDIRDGADVGFDRIDTLRFRARLFDIGAVALLAGGVLIGVLAMAAFVSRARQGQARERPRVSERRVLAAAGAELSRVARESASGWTPELISAGHAALRVVAAVALGRGVSEQRLAHGASATDGRIPVRAVIPGRPGAAVTSATTPADVARALADPARPIEQRAGLEALHAALTTFTVTRFAAEDAGPDAGALAGALDAGQRERSRLARDGVRRWFRSVVTLGPRAARTSPS
ncbi:MAG TPA: hypothetical protein PLH72_00820 [Vicinamibacterales bacterium]|nr:hypothetical protein [Vicinamibacterales bacterium]